MPTQDEAIGIIAQMAATLLAGTPNSNAASAGASTVEGAVRTANAIYEKVVESRPTKPKRAMAR